MINDIKKFVKQEKGSITLFVLSAMLFFVTILTLTYMSQVDKVNNQKKQIEQVQAQYNVDKDMDRVYEETKERQQET